MTQCKPSRRPMRYCAIHWVLTSPMSGGAVFRTRCRTIHQPTAAMTATKTRMPLADDCAAATTCSMAQVPVSAHRCSALWRAGTLRGQRLCGRSCRGATTRCGRSPAGTPRAGRSGRVRTWPCTSRFNPATSIPGASRRRADKSPPWRRAPATEQQFPPETRQPKTAALLREAGGALARAAPRRTTPESAFPSCPARRATPTEFILQT